MKNGKYGKDHPESFIAGALTGGSGPSEGVHEFPVDRKGQKIVMGTAMDNVCLAMDLESSMEEKGGFRGGTDNLKHSLSGGGSAENGVGAAGPVKHVIISNH